MTIRLATLSDVEDIKTLADQHTKELGWLPRPAYVDAVRAGRVFVCEAYGGVVGFLKFTPRRDRVAVINSLVVDENWRGHSLGRGLVTALVSLCHTKRVPTIRLSCPEGLQSNDFYNHCGFRLLKTVAGKKRRLNVWYMHLPVDALGPSTTNKGTLI